MKPFEPFPARRSTLVLVGAMAGSNALALLMVVALAVHGMGQMGSEEDTELRVATGLIEDAYRLKVAIEKQLLGHRSYLYSERPEARRPWHEGLAEFRDAVASLRRVQQDPADGVLLDRVVAAQASYLALEARLDRLLQAGRFAEARAIYGREGFPHKARMVGASDALIAEKREVVRRLHTAVDDVEGVASARLAAAAFVSIPLSLLLAATIALRVLGPLRSLEQAARAIERGDLGVRVPARRDDEFGHVAEAFNRMAAAVETSVRDLKAANAELVRIDHYREDFLSTVTHELKTPLTTILGFAEALSRPGAVPEGPRRSATRIAKHAERMRRLVEDLLDSAVIRQGKLDLALMALDPSPVVAEAVAQLRGQAQEAGVMLAVDLVPGPPAAVDPERVAQVVTNLVTNAIKFSPPGGGVTIAGRPGPTGYRVEVRDEGPGIPAEQAAQAFEPFVRLAPRDGRRRPGTGLGLWIARALVEAHGGAIGLQPGEERGAVAWFELPLA